MVDDNQTSIPDLLREISYVANAPPDFDSVIQQFVLSYDKYGIDLLENNCISSNDRNKIWLWEIILRGLGNCTDEVTHTTRLLFLERQLLSPYTDIRDAAMLGLASMDDPRSLFALRIAKALEVNRKMMNDFDLVISQLEETLNESA